MTRPTPEIWLSRCARKVSAISLMARSEIVSDVSASVKTAASAVQRGPVGAFSYVIGDGDIVAAKPVTVTQQNETQAVIGSGLAASDRVVTTGFANLSDGAKVIVGKDEQTPSADLAPRKKGSRGPQTRDGQPKDAQTKDAPAKDAVAKDAAAKDGAAGDSSGKDGQGKDGERRKRRSQSEGDPSGGAAKAQP